MHGLNEKILETGLAVDYNEVSRETEKLRLGMTGADSFSIDFEVEGLPYHLEIDVNRQVAQKSHGLCHTGPDIANLPAGEVYFVPTGAEGQFPIKFDDGTIGLMTVKEGKGINISLIRGNQKTIDEVQSKLKSDPATGVLGELGFGTQVLPYSGRDIQDEKIFGTFHLATGRNDHLSGTVVKESFLNPRNATHDDILFSSTKTPEIHVKQVLMRRNGKTEAIIKNYEPSNYLLGLIEQGA
jgi:leucyl aminopeptidase (aminopeptidase T)